MSDNKILKYESKKDHQSVINNLRVSHPFVETDLSLGSVHLKVWNHGAQKHLDALNHLLCLDELNVLNCRLIVRTLEV